MIIKTKKYLKQFKKFKLWFYINLWNHESAGSCRQKENKNHKQLEKIVPKILKKFEKNQLIPDKKVSILFSLLTAVQGCQSVSFVISGVGIMC